MYFYINNYLYLIVYKIRGLVPDPVGNEILLYSLYLVLL